MKRVYLSSEENQAPLSGAIEANGMIFVSGQIHSDSDWNLCGDTIEEKFNIAITNVERILSEAGCTRDDIVRIQLYLTDLNELPNLNKVYTEYFQHPFPARTAVEVSNLPLNASLEIDVVAVAQNR